MPEKKRQRRRRDEWRTKGRVRKIMCRIWGYKDNELTPKAVGRQAAIHLAHYPCALCSTSRRSLGPPHSERRRGLPLDAVEFEV